MSAIDRDRIINRIITIPNSFSILRILLIPFIVYYLSRENGIIPVVILSIAACVTDFFDGYFARKLDQISDIGKILDPLADKIAVTAIVIGLVIYRDFPLWALYLIVFRDVLILVVGLYVMKQKAFVPASNLLGKVTVCVYAALVFVYILNLEALKVYILSGSIVFLFLSLLGYYRVLFIQSSKSK